MKANIENNFQWKHLTHQYYAAIVGMNMKRISQFKFRNLNVFPTKNRLYCIHSSIANLISFGQGCVLGWLSPSLPRLMSEDTPLKSGKLTSDQLSWIGSLSSIGGFFGVLTFGSFTTLIGCKNAMLFLAVPSIAFWFLIFFGDTYHYIMAARFFNGWAHGGTSTIIVLYISELANNK